MKSFIRISACSLLFLSPALSLAGKKNAPPPQNSPTAITPDAAAFLNSALDILQQHDLRSASQDWAALRLEAFKRAGGAFNPIDTYPAIYWTLVQLNDSSSRLRLPPGLYPDQISLLQQAEKDAKASAPAAAGPDAPPTPFATRSLPEGHVDTVQGRTIAYVVLPRCSAKDNDGLLLYAADVRRILTGLAAQKPQAWVVDMRGNTGGNMWPMLAGIGPILGEGIVGSFSTADGNIPWFYQDGKSGTRNTAGLETVSLNLQDAPLRLTDPAPVAVLVDSSTANSAEAVAIAFHGRAQTRFFGQQTAGKSTAVQPFQLSDGAEIYLTTAVDADRNGKVFPDGLTPDVALPEVSALPQPGSDPEVIAAETWLATMTAPPAAPAPVVKPKRKRKKVVIHQGS
jgi:hypothetical protein